ncbi:hypothetical protein ACWEF9_22100 [Streptomyces sp. NPDC004980]
MFAEIVFVGLAIDCDEDKKALRTGFEFDGEVTGRAAAGVVALLTWKSRAAWTQPRLRDLFS